VILGQVNQKSNRPQIETIRHIVLLLKFQFDCAYCFQRGETSALLLCTVSALETQTQNSQENKHGVS